MERELAFFAALGYAQEGEQFSDPLQGIAGCFITGPGPRIELLQNLPGSDTLTPWLNSGIRLYHFAWLVADMTEALRWARLRRAKVTVPPVPSVAFHQRHIAFVIFANGLMIEFVEKQQAARPSNALG